MTSPSPFVSVSTSLPKSLPALLGACLSLSLPFSAQADAAPHRERLQSLGDSATQGVQSNVAAWQTQLASYPKWLAKLGGLRFKLPYIQASETGQTGIVADRPRLHPNSSGDNLAVAGATVEQLLHAQANAATEAEIDSELDLVLYPRQLSQMEAVEANPADLMTVWVGSNDILNAVTAVGQLNGSQLTSVADFDAAYTELADRLDYLQSTEGTDVVLANLPDVLAFPYLFDAADIQGLFGIPGALPPGTYTTFPIILQVASTGNFALLGMDDFLLDPGEIALIQQRTDDFNAIIAREANRIGAPLVDLNAIFADYQVEGPTFMGQTLSTDYLGGLFTFDGIHPNNVGQALIAQAFADVIREDLGRHMPRIPRWLMNFVYLSDPHIDKDGDGKVRGRPGVGALEGLALGVLQWSGDPDDLDPNVN